jgi:hypothetical protein
VIDGTAVEERGSQNRGKTSRALGLFEQALTYSELPSARRIKLCKKIAHLRIALEDYPKAFIYVQKAIAEASPALMPPLMCWLQLVNAIYYGIHDFEGMLDIHQQLLGPIPEIAIC